jgi:lincosamide nucleotidyltransferase A/C/D/E
VEEQLAALARVSSALEASGIDYWLFGGWARDFYAGEVTRAHGDVDLAVWLDDLPRIVRLLERDGWRHAPEEDEDGGTGYEREGVRLELTFLVHDDAGRICIAMHAGPMPWAQDAFGDHLGELHGVRARLIGRTAL